MRTMHHAIFVILLLTLCAVCLAQDMPEPAYKTMSREQLEAAYIAKLEETAQLRRELAASQKQIKELQMQIDEAKPKTAPGTPTDEKVGNTMTIPEAIKAHVVVMGMTVKQAVQATGKPLYFYGTDSDYSSYRMGRGTVYFPISGTKTVANPTGLVGRWCTFVFKNKIVAVERQDGFNHPLTIKWPETPIE